MRSLSAIAKKRWQSPEYRRKQDLAHRGRVQPTETREKISLSLKGRKVGLRSLEHRKKLSMALKGKEKSEEHKKNISLARRGNGKINCSGYVYLWVPEHPFASRRGYVAEHRLVMEKKLGRLINPEEVIHHVDFNRANNTPDNLVLFKNCGYHFAFHLQFDPKKGGNNVIAICKK